MRSGRSCTRLHESSDPDTWSDNDLCSTVDHGFRWSSAGAISGMRCTRIIELSEPSSHTWYDNDLCVPTSSSLQLSWSAAGPIAGRQCILIHESADPDDWHDNHPCY